MKVTVLSLVASLTSFLIAGPVVAGSKQSNPVSVSQSGRVATGAGPHLDDVELCFRRAAHDLAAYTGRDRSNHQVRRRDHGAKSR